MAVRALSTAATGMTSIQKHIDVIANNLANVNTTGFKKSRAEFQDLLYQYMKLPGFSATAQGTQPTGIQFGVGTNVVSTNRLFSQGPLTQTDNDLDVAINGDGFFRVIVDENGTIGYTRDGSFKKDGAGQLLTSNGMLLADQITVPAGITRVQILTNGAIQGFDPTNPLELTNLGQFTLSRFVNPAGLRALGDNLYMQTDASGVAIDSTPGTQGIGDVRQHFLEEANVEVVQELVDMIAAQRAFEMNGQTIQAADQMLQTVNNLRR
ncbi:MAG: flagellar basal-body rod protein FlgG [Planctomycetes bacterium]|nr:flagellar basal-body rod protein FlgG [Planctomycetota bacterium]